MCYQVCIACPFSSRFSKTKQETSNTWRKPLRSVGVAPIKNDHQKKGPRAIVGHLRGMWVVFDFSKKLVPAPFGTVGSGSWSCFCWQKLCNKQTPFLLEGFFFGWKRDPCSWMHLFAFLFWGDDFPTSTSPRPGISYSHSETKGMRRTAGQWSFPGSLNRW